MVLQIKVVLQLPLSRAAASTVAPKSSCSFHCYTKVVLQLPLLPCLPCLLLTSLSSIFVFNMPKWSIEEYYAKKHPDGQAFPVTLDRNNPDGSSFLAVESLAPWMGASQNCWPKMGAKLAPCHQNKANQKNRPTSLEISNIMT